MSQGLVALALAVVLAAPGGITAAKGHSRAFRAGFFTFGVAWLYAAARLARGRCLGGGKSFTAPRRWRGLITGFQLTKAHLPLNPQGRPHRF
jgi:hypothetical protein